MAAVSRRKKESAFGIHQKLMGWLLISNCRWIYWSPAIWRKPDNTPLDERTAIAINRYNLNAVISEADIEREFVVPAELSDAPNEQMYVNLKVKSMDDLSPDHIASQVPEIKRLLELREALVALKSPLGNIPAFRAQLQALLENEDSREQLIQELGIAAQK